MLNKIQFSLVVSLSYIYILVDRIHQKKLEKEAFKNNENNVCSDQNVQNQIERLIILAIAKRENVDSMDVT